MHRYVAAGLVAALLGSACNTAPVLTRLIDARRMAAALRAAFLQANEAANRAVLANSDAESTAAARESGAATEEARKALGDLEPVLTGLGYRAELDALGRITTLFDEYTRLDAEILGLAVENTNLKAQRLSFADAQQAADAFSAALDRGVAASSPAAARIAAEQARTAVARIQVIQARHIAEAGDAEMTRMETQMQALETDARTRLESLQRALPASRGDLSAAAAALDNFAAVNREIVQLSRRNSNVRSLELTFGRKRVVAAALDDQLRVLVEELGKHGSEATR